MIVGGVKNESCGSTSEQSECVGGWAQSVLSGCFGYWRIGVCLGGKGGCKGS